MRKGTLSIIIVLMMVFSASMGLITASLAEGKEAEGSSDYPSNLDDNSAHFIPNEGQWNDEIKYLAETDYGAFLVLGDSVMMHTITETKELENDMGDTTPVHSGYNVGVEFLNHKSFEPVAKDEKGSRLNWIRADEQVSDVKTYETIVFEDIWENIDMRYYFSGSGLKYDLILHPGSSPSQIKMRINGQKDLKTTTEGLEIVLDDDNSIHDTSLDIFYNDDHKSKIPGNFRLINYNTYTFDLGTYDASKSIVIDPLYFSTFLAGGGDDYPFGIAVDDDDYIYIAGYTSSPSSYGSFPTTTGAYSTTRSSSSYEGYVSKLENDGSDLVWSTFIGGYGSDYLKRIAVDSDDNPYITGYTYYSSSGVYPTTTGAYQTSFTYSSYPDAFVTKLSTDGSSLVWSTLIGGAYYDYGFGIDVDSNEDVHICGRTAYYGSYTPTYGDFPTTTGAYQTSRPYIPSSTYSSTYDGFVAKINNDGASLDYSTFLGSGSSNDYPYAIEVDDDDDAYVTGYTDYDSSNPFPTTTDAYQESMGNSYEDAFLAKFDSTGDADYCTLIGGDYYDYAFDIEIDSQERAIISGTSRYSSYYTTDDFPTTDDSYMPERSGEDDHFVTKFTNDGTDLVFSTFFGGTDDEWYDAYSDGRGASIYIGPNDNIYLAGSTDSDDLPDVNSMYEDEPANYEEFYVANLSSDASYLNSYSYIGSGYHDRLYGGVVVDSQNRAIISGYTYYSSYYWPTYGSWPTTSGAYDTTSPQRSNYYDGVVASFSDGSTDETSPTLTSDNSDPIAYSNKDFTFKPRISDNEDLARVYVEYWFGSTGDHHMDSFDYRYPMNVYSDFEHTILLPKSTDPMYYRFIAYDTQGNELTTSTKNLNLVDGTPPQYSNIELDPEEPVTGKLNVSIDWVDNVLISSYTFQYRFNQTASFTPVTSAQLVGDTYTWMINITDDVDELYFNSGATDLGGNSESTPVIFEEVNRPQFYNNTVHPSPLTTGSWGNITINVSDNGDLDEESVEMHYNIDGSWISVDMHTSDDELFWANISDVDGSTTMEYYFTAVDDNDYTGTSQTFTVAITDDDDPTYTDNSDTEGTTGDDFEFDVTASDNVEVDDVSVSWSHDTTSGTISLADDGDGTYSGDVTLEDSVTSFTYTLTVTDTSGNSVSDSMQTITVTDNDEPEYDNIEIDPDVPVTGTQYMSIDWTDNTGVMNPTLYYRLDNTSSYSSSTSATVTGDTHEYSVSIPTTCDHLYYYFTANDTGGNLVTTPIGYEMVNLPQPGTPTLTPSSPTTGENLNITIDVTDNDEVSAVEIHYEIDGTWTTSSMSFYTGDTYAVDITPDGGLSMDYYFTATDDNGFENDTETWTQAITDNDDPTYTDNSPSTGETGDSFTFDVTASDNVDVANVTIQWDHDITSGWFFMSDDGDGTYSGSITLEQSVSSMSYTIKVNDTSDNSVSSSSTTVTVSDDEEPEYSNIVQDPDDPITGNLALSIDWTDNIGVTNPTVYYRLDNSSSYTALTTYTQTGDTYSFDITVTSSTDWVYYNFTADDAAGHLVSTATFSDKVNLPQIDDPVLSPTDPTTGEALNITVDVTDNDDVELVVLHYNDDGSWYTMNMTIYTGDTYSADITLDGGSEDLLYYVKAYDDNDFDNETVQYTKTIVDNDNPTYTDNSPSTGETGDTFTFDVTASDNVDVANVTIHWDHDITSGWFFMSDDGDGTYSGSITLDESVSSMTYTIKVNDTSDNSVSSSSTTVTVSDDEEPEYSNIVQDPEDPITGNLDLSIDWTDNTGVLNPTLYYRLDNTSAYTSTTTSVNVGDTYTYTLTVGSSVDHIYYYFTANDTGGNLVTTSVINDEVNIPQLGDPTVTPASPNTGDSVNVTIDITDNGDIDNVTFHYDIGDGNGYQWVYMTHSSGDEYFYEQVVDGILSLDWYIRAVDDNGWENETAEETQTITDDDDPTYTDNTGSSGTTGDSFSFDVTASDNVEIDTVEVSWSHGSLSGTLTLSDDGDGTYSGSVDLDDSLSSMNYAVTVTDSSANSVTSSSASVSVTDNDPPEYSNIDQDPEDVITGNLDISVEWTENIAITDVKLEYRLDNTSDFSDLTTYTQAGDVYTFTLSIPAGTDHLYYNLSANDTSGNLVVTSTYYYEVNIPQLSSVGLTPSPLTTGEAVNVTIDVTDDGTVEEVMLHYNDDGNWHSMEMTLNSGDTYDIEFNVDSGSTSFMYYIVAEDDNGHTNTTTTTTLSVTDNDDPTYTDNSPSTGTTADQYDFDLTISDNVEIDTVELTWDHDNLGTTVYMTDDGDGTYSHFIMLDDSVASMTYSVVITDTSGNSVTVPMTTVTISDNDDPTFSGIDILPAVPKTGEWENFIVTVDDNIGYTGSTVTLFHRDTTDSTFTSVSMNHLVGDTYYVDVAIPNYYSWMYYYFEATDTSSNVGSSAIRDVEVYDDEAPTFVSDNCPVPTTGDSYTFDFTFNDNVGIDYAYVEYWFGDTGSHTRLSLDISGDGLGDDQTMTTTITIPFNSLEKLNYFYHFRDDEGNWWEDGPSSEFNKTVVDNDHPWVTSVQSTDPTTGDPYFFSIGIDDNIDGSDVVSVHVLWTYANDWANADNMTLTYDPSSELWNSSVFNVQLNSLDVINYNITAVDLVGNWMNDRGYMKTVYDNDLPSMESDLTTGTATTGDSKTFTMNAVDNIEVLEVYLSYRYDNGNYSNMILMTQGTGNNWFFVEEVEHTLYDLHYNFTIIDTSYNTHVTSNSTIQMIDNDKPDIFSDMAPKVAEAGQENYPFRVMVFDNIQVGKVEVHYWFDFDTTENIVNMRKLSNNIWYTMVDLPVDSGKMSYWYYAEDIMPAQNNNDTEDDIQEVSVLDNRPPVLGDMEYPSVATTGDTVALSLDATDDVGIDSVFLYYYFGEEPDVVPSMEATSSGGTFSVTVEIPDSLDDLNFWFEVNDKALNTITTDLITLEVVDNDDPMFDSFMSHDEAYTGEEFMFKVNASDNIGVDHVDVTYTISGMDPVTVMMMNNMSSYCHSIIIPDDNAGNIEFYFTVYDTSGNMFESVDVFNVSIEDDEGPVAVIDAPESAYQHVNVTFSAMMSSDNVGIISYSWEIMGESLDGEEVIYVFDDVGEYVVTLIVSDGVNPAVETNVTIMIRDADAPVIDLLAPDEMGNHELFSADASGSTDNVGIVLYEWTLVLPDNSVVEGTGPTFEYDLEGALGELTLHLSVFDEEGNEASLVKNIMVKDMLAPTAVGPEDREIFEGNTLKFSDQGSTDNVGVVDWVWTVNDDQIFVGQELVYFFEEPGEYNISLTVSDSAGNNDTAYFIVTVLEKGEDFDGDNDGMPDDWEEENGLDTEVNDRDQDPDGDLLTNYQEYRLGTDPRDPDTDDDGLPDKYEYDHMPELDPLEPGDAEEDSDGDGDSNLEEYLEGPTVRDPTVDDVEEEEEDNTTLILLLLIVAGLVVLAIMAAVVVVGGKKKEAREDFPENEFPHLHK